MLTTPILLKILLTFCFTSCVLSLGLDFLSEDEASEILSPEAPAASRLHILPSILGEQSRELASVFPDEGRFLLPIFLGASGLNLTFLATLAVLGASAMLPLLGLLALGFLMAAALGGSAVDALIPLGSSYATGYRKLDDMKNNWQSLSLMDWLSVAEETYTKYEPSNLDCQKRIICEFFHYAPALGWPAQTFVKYFSYLNYVEVFNIPESIKELIQEIIGAADQGRMVKKDCEDIFSDCLFSLKEMIKKYRPLRFVDKNENKI